MLGFAKLTPTYKMFGVSLCFLSPEIRKYELRDGNKIRYETDAGFLFIFKAYKQAHRKLYNCLYNAEDELKDKLVSYLIKFTFLIH